MLRSMTLAAALFLAACDSGSADEPKDADTYADGQTRYRDADTDSDGSAREPAMPGPQSSDEPMWVEIAIEGSGDLDITDPECELDSLSGSFSGLYSGEAEIDNDGIYIAALASSEAEFTSPSGCTLPDLSISSVSEVVVKGYLSATQENCDTYCAASARSHAEAECEGSSDEASCRAEQEAEYSASCTQTCTGSTTYAIYAESALSATALAELNGAALTGTALGSLEVDLPFDRIVDETDNTVDEQ